MAPVGVAKTAPRRFARMMQLPGEAREATRARLLEWAKAQTIPAGDRVAVEPVEDFDEEKDKSEFIGYRTYLLQGPAVIDGSDIAEAVPMFTGDRGLGGWVVSITLTKKGADGFYDFTAAHQGRRMAIVLDGNVVSAPRILGAIEGGHVQITMGAGAPEEQHKKALELTAHLLGVADPASL